MSERESLTFDVLVVGAGPSGLATAIHIKRLNPDIEVAVLEKGSQVGAHILSGAVIDPSGLDALIPDWRNRRAPLTTTVSHDDFFILGKRQAIPLPNWTIPPLMSNHGNYVGSLGRLCEWLGTQAEEMGVQVFPGFAGSELLIEEGRLQGVATVDIGRTAQGEEGPGFQPSVELRAPITVLAEGARGSLTKAAMNAFSLEAGRSPQKYGLGMKELWRIDPALHRPGLIQHFLGWPLDANATGGGFLYHFDNDLVAVGLVVHLDYKNPYLAPFEEFQRFKQHPAISPVFNGAERLQYGARAISEGGWQSVPKLSFPGGVVVGDAAGFINLPRIKGSHNAIHSGMLAARSVVDALAADLPDTDARLDQYDQAWRTSQIGADLHPVRNVKPLLSRYGTALGTLAGGFDMWVQTLIKWSPFGTLAHRLSDARALEPASLHQPIAYPPPDGVLTFDKLSSVYLSSTNHREGQPKHLVVLDERLQQESELGEFAGPSTRYCPAGVYEWVRSDEEMRYVINAQNCVHCKTCDIKDPNSNIRWTVPEGGDGPLYMGL